MTSPAAEPAEPTDTDEPMSGPSLRIDLLHPCYWPEVRRGSERFIHDLGSRLATRGLSMRLITSYPGRRSTAVEDGIEVLRLHRPRGRRLQLGLRSEYVTHLPGSYRALRRGDADIAHALYPTDAIAAGRWARRTGKPTVFSLMGMPRPESMDRRLWRRIAASALRRADVAVALSETAAARTADAFGVTPRVITPGVDLAVFRPSATRAQTPTVLCPADLGDPRKRGVLLLAAFRLLREGRPEARLVLSRPRGLAVVEEAGSRTDLTGEPGVELTDLDSHDALVEAYSSAWVTVLPSQAEAFGLVLVESLACGTPVVAAAGGGGEEVVGEGVGALIRSDDPEELASAMHETMAAGEDSRSACVARAGLFSADRCADAYEALYRELA